MQQKCTNMYHDLGDGKRGELIFQPYTIWNIAGAKLVLGYTDPLVPIRQSPNYRNHLYPTRRQSGSLYRCT
jgi:2',3'-cyclic-nucleotide 2'-phosphodiesterase (5'-nucleotidase family)